MRRLAAVAVVAVALLLAAVAWELHAVNSRLGVIVAILDPAAPAGGRPVAAPAAETREQRIERRARELRETSDETAEVWRRILANDRRASSATIAPSQTPAAPAGRSRAPQVR
jgi:hypothetical protein